MNANDRIAIDDSSEIDLVALWRVIWNYKYLIASVTGVFGTIAIFLALTATPVYRAEVVVTEVHDGGMGPVASLANQFGGLASLAGINLGASGGERESQAVLASRRLVEEFIKRHHLIPELFPDAKKPPSLWLAVKKFQEGVLSIREDKRSETTRIAINWKDPATSALWANGVVSLADELIRSRALDDATRNIAYLNGQITKTSVVELQRVMYNLIESETKTLMLANAKAEYAFNVIDPAVPPEIRISPKRTVMVIVGAVLGFFAGTIAAFTLNILARRSRSVSEK